MSEPEFTAAASRLCTACGMCCNGVLFHIVRLQPSDSVKGLEALGMKLNRKKREPYFNQPCRFLQDCCCTIYEARPLRCRMFECRQIKGLANGEISETEAAAKITEVRRQVALIESLLMEQGNAEKQRPLMERCTQVLQEKGKEAPAALLEALRALHELLNDSFRLEPVELGV